MMIAKHNAKMIGEKVAKKHPQNWDGINLCLCIVNNLILTRFINSVGKGIMRVNQKVLKGELKSLLTVLMFFLLILSSYATWATKYYFSVADELAENDHYIEGDTRADAILRLLSDDDHSTFHANYVTNLIAEEYINFIQSLENLGSNRVGFNSFLYPWITAAILALRDKRRGALGFQLPESDLGDLAHSYCPDGSLPSLKSIINHIRKNVRNCYINSYDFYSHRPTLLVGVRVAGYFFSRGVRLSQRRHASRGPLRVNSNIWRDQDHRFPLPASQIHQIQMPAIMTEIRSIGGVSGLNNYIRGQSRYWGNSTNLDYDIYGEIHTVTINDTANYTHPVPTTLLEEINGQFFPMNPPDVPAAAGFTGASTVYELELEEEEERNRRRKYYFR